MVYIIVVGSGYLWAVVIMFEFTGVGSLWVVVA